MRVLITGSAGMLGQKLTERLLTDGRLAGRELTAIDLADVVETPARANMCTSIVADLSESGVAEEVIATKPDVVFHLAGVVSGEAEADFEKGTRVNLDGTRMLFDAIRLAPSAPRVVFTSSIAVFGAPFPDPIPDDFHLTPLTSYGTQKMIGEALLADYTRREFFDGVGIRLPTISVRPGTPNAAASGFFSNIIREPLDGREAVLPVRRMVRHTHASPRAAVGYLIRAAEIDSGMVGSRPNLTMPGVSVTVQDQLDALGRATSPEVVALVREEHDAAIAAIVAGWPERFDTVRARSLGFEGDDTYDAIVAAHIEDELNRE